MFRTGAQMSLLVLLAGLFLLWSSRFAPVQDFDDLAGNTLRQVGLVSHLTKLPPPAPVALVAINDSSASSRPWPWTPLDYSLYVQAANGFRPEVLAIGEVIDSDPDLFPDADRRKLPQYENILRGFLLRSEKVLLAAQLGWPEDADTVLPIQGLPIVRKVKGDLLQVPEWSVIEREPKEEFRLSSAAGFINVPDPMRAVYTAPLIFRCQGNVVPSLTLEAVRLWLKASLDDIVVVLGSHIDIGSKLRIPIDAHGAVRVNFGAPYLAMGFDELLLANEQIAAKQKAVVPVEKLTKGIALLARTDAKAPKLHLGSGRDGTVGELLASAIATIQSGAYLSRASAWLSWALLAVAVVVAGWVPTWKKSRVLLGAFLAVLVYAGVVFALASMKALLLPVVLPVGLALFIALYRLATPNNVWKLKRPVIF